MSGGLRRSRSGFGTSLLLRRGSDQRNELPCRPADKRPGAAPASDAALWCLLFGFQGPGTSAEGQP